VTRIGVIGTAWRAEVNGWGRVEPLDGSAALDWLVGADDRWYRPESEPTIRQELLRGAPVVVTRMRVPGGDAIHRVAAVADRGGHTVVEVENDSPLPFALAFTRGGLTSASPPTTVRPVGVELPAGAVLFPVAHRALRRVTIAHVAGAAWPGEVASVDAVALGWRTQCDRGTRYELPDRALGEAAVSARCRVLLDGPVSFSDPVDRLLAAGEWLRLGRAVEDLVEPVVRDAQRAARATARAATVPRRLLWALRSALDVLAESGQARAAGDVAAILQRLPPRLEPTPDASDGPGATGPLDALGLVRSMTVATAAGSVVLVPSPPAPWLGRDLAVYDEPTPVGSLSFAVRWHGARPALLWELAGDGPAEVRCGLDPRWCSQDRRGEALLSEPEVATRGRSCS